MLINNYKNCRKYLQNNKFIWYLKKLILSLSAQINRLYQFNIKTKNLFQIFINNMYTKIFKVLVRVWKNICENIFENRNIQIELKNSIYLQQAILESTTDGVLIVNNKGKIIKFNQKFLQMWQIPELLIKSGNYHKLLKLVLSQVEKPKDCLRILKKLQSHLERQSLDAIALNDGRVFEVCSKSQRIQDKIIGRVWSFRDLTTIKIAEAKIRHQELYDLLTNIPNRIFFQEKLALALTAAKRKNCQVSVCLIKLHRLKIINNTLGHKIGDKLLQTVAKSIENCLGKNDIIGRWGDNEFILLLPQFNSHKSIRDIQEKILAAFKLGFDIDNHHLHISTSFGVSTYPHDGKDAETLIQYAETALYRSKFQGQNYLINSQALELLVLQNSLYHALEREELTIYYQPQINTLTGKIMQMEALLRWQHRKLGLIPPAKFIPIAEETGLIIPIGEWILRTACTQNKTWQEQINLPFLSVAVNLSVRQFQQPNLVEVVRQILAETKLNPQCLDLEITESIAMQNIDLTKVILKELHKMNINISIDDFGTGYSSLSYLKNFPIQNLKIDKSFVQSLTTNTRDAAITSVIISLAHELNLGVIAEGVETEEQCNFLQRIRCNIMQGNFFSHPVCVKDATKLLRNWQLNCYMKV